MPTREDPRLQRLLDEREIEQLLVRYCTCADANDAAGLAACFTPDCVARYGPGPPSIGADARRRQAEHDLAMFAATSHHLSNIVIEHVDVGRARVQSAVYAWHRPLGDGGDWHLWGRYHDAVVRTEAGWRIAERTLVRVGERGFPPAWTWFDHERRPGVAEPETTRARPHEGLAGPLVMCAAHGPVLTISVHRPDVRNAFNREIAELVSDALDRLERDDDLHVGILHGAGGVFSSGMDLRAFARGEIPAVGEHGLLGLVARTRVKPLIAAVDGYAIAAGFEVALACDLIVAARDARFVLPEVTRGLVPAGGSLRNLPARVPLGVATDLALTGRPLPARRAAQLGLVARLAEPGRSLEAALDLAGEIAASSPPAVRAIKAVLDGQRVWPGEAFWEHQAEVVAAVQTGRDAQEGAAAFLEHRDPRWGIDDHPPAP